MAVMQASVVRGGSVSLDDGVVRPQHLRPVVRRQREVAFVLEAFAAVVVAGPGCVGDQL